MIYAFALNRFRCGSLSGASGCSAVIDDKRKTLQISNLDEDDMFSAQEVPLDAISGITFGHESNTMMLGIDTSASKSTSRRDWQMFLDFQPASERGFFYKVLEKACGEGKLHHEYQDKEFRRWEDETPEAEEKGEVHDQSAAQRSHTASPQEEATEAHIDLPEPTTEPDNGYQLNDKLPLPISQVLKVLDGYDRKEKRVQDLRGQLVEAQAKVARQKTQIAALAVALMNPDAVPPCMTEQDLHEYLASPSIGLRADEMAALNSVPRYRQAVGLDSRKVGARKSAK